MIYAVEDDRNIRELIVYALRQSGFEAEGFEDGSRLMELPAPELVILDIMLPGEDGLSILRRLARGPRAQARAGDPAHGAFRRGKPRGRL